MPSPDLPDPISDYSIAQTLLSDGLYLAGMAVAAMPWALLAWVWFQ